MTDTQRRVGELTLETGDGEGACLALFVLPQERVEPAVLKPRFEAGLRQAGIHAARLFCTAPALSVSLTASKASKEPALPTADALVLIEGSDAEATRALAGTLADGAEVRTFQMLWRMSA
jgi:hypothetical protein